MNKRTRESRNRKTKRTRKPKKIVRENLERTESRTRSRKRKYS